MQDDLIGKQIGGYEILGHIGQGGMATVYRARQLSMNRTVALKILPRHHVRDETYLKRFEREVAIIAQLEHRSIVPVHDYGQHDGQPYIAMRYMSGGSVDDMLKRDGSISLETTLKIIEQVAPALDFAHTKNILHRDLKPSNILLDEDGGAFLTDFGIARIVGVEDKGNTITTQGVVGTPSYMSPEQAQGHTLDGRSDVYALGISLFEMLTGQRPFQNDTPYSIAVMQVTAQPPSPRSINPKITAAVEQVIFKALKKQRENRYQTAVQLAESLRLAFERPDSVHDTQPSGVPKRSPPPTLEVTQPTPRPASPPGVQQVSLSLGGQPAVPNASPMGVPSGSPGTPMGTPQQQVPVNQQRPPLNVRERVRRPQRRNNFWRNMLLGGILGCGLVALIAVGALVAVDAILNQGEADNTLAGEITPEVTEESTATLADNASTTPVITVPPTFQLTPLDPTSEAARDSLIPDEQNATLEAAIDDGSTPTPTTSEDESEPTAISMALGGALPPPERILYFNGNLESNIYLYNLTTDIEFSLTADESANSYPIASPDGEQIVFQSNRDGDFEIYVMNITGASLRRITNNGFLDRLPGWSPNGEWIVYSADSRGDGLLDIFRMRADGTGEPEVLVQNGQRNSHPRYSYDGRYVVFTSGGDDQNSNTWEIWRYEPGIGELVELTDNSVRDASPVFSPDDRQILFITDETGQRALATMNIDGSNMKILHEGTGFIWGANYSADGEFIIFNDQDMETSESRIYQIRSDGSDLEQLDVPDGGFYPSYVPQVATP